MYLLPNPNKYCLKKSIENESYVTIQLGKHVERAQGCEKGFYYMFVYITILKNDAYGYIFFLFIRADILDLYQRK